MRLYRIRIALAVFAAALLVSCESTKKGLSENATTVDDVEYWLTSGDKSVLLQRQVGKVAKGTAEPEGDVIAIDTATRFQTMDGFGFTLTGGSAWLLKDKLSDEKRADILRELFTTNDNNVGVSYLRISVGASDLDAHVFSYADYSGGKPKDLNGFTLEEDKKYLIPVLKEILALNPDIKIMGSPWSAPAWMKTNNHVKGGSLRKEHYSDYARYFVKYIQGMKEEGIRIDAITIQNEPENPKNTPSMVMTAEEQADFVKNHLGPAFRQADIDTKIVVFDHNCDHPEYPITILNDAEAKKYVDGSAFHLYLGDIKAMSKVHDAHPDRNIYFTEQWTSGEGQFDGDLFWHTRELVIGAPRNWAKNVLEWNLANDPKFHPHTDDGGCTICQGALTIDTDSITRNVSYYIIAQASKFVPAGSVRIESTYLEKIPNVAFLTPQGKKVLIALNESKDEKAFSLKDGKHTYTTSIPKGSVVTFVW